MAVAYQTREIQTAANDVADTGFQRTQVTNPTWTPKPAKASTKLVEGINAMLARFA
jgi:hypothetical protein